MASCSAVWSEDAKYFSWMPRVLKEGRSRLGSQAGMRDWPGQDLTSPDDCHPNTVLVPTAGCEAFKHPSLGILFLPHTADTKGPESTSIQLCMAYARDRPGCSNPAPVTSFPSSEESHESHDYKMSASSPGRAAAVTIVTFFFLPRERTPTLFEPQGSPPSLWDTTQVNSQKEKSRHC